MPILRPPRRGKPHLHDESSVRQAALWTAVCVSYGRIHANRQVHGTKSGTLY
ncbi:MAG: hypothetical protein WCB53_21845 [Terriglobales bacterium]